jgi:hypothetical protein
LWTALAVIYCVPLPSWATAGLALVVGILYVCAIRERLVILAGPAFFWRERRRSLTALAATTLMLIWYFEFVTPNPEEDWIPKHAQMPRVEIDGDKVRVTNVRNFTWHTATDFSPGYYDRTYDLSALSSVYYALSPIHGIDEVAHVWLCFGFSDGQHVAVSVEARLRKGASFRLLGSMFRQFQLIYVIGDERDVLGLRGAIWKSEVRLYPARSTAEGRRALFLDMMRRAHALEEHPEFYNLFANNCMNNISYHLRRLGGLSLPSELRLLLTGFSDQYAYDYGFIDTNLPFEEARKAYRVDEWIQQTQLDEGFSARLREVLKRQGADKVP